MLVALETGHLENLKRIFYPIMHENGRSFTTKNSLSTDTLGIPSFNVTFIMNDGQILFPLASIILPPFYGCIKSFLNMYLPQHLTMLSN